jgi:hypothetical protein
MSRYGIDLQKMGHSGRADKDFEWQLFNSGTAFQKVEGRIHMGSCV